MDPNSNSNLRLNPMISHAVITGGTIIQARENHHHLHDNRQFYGHGAKGGFERIEEAVAPAAFHNSGERFDPPKCHPNTRVAVIQKIMDWILGLDSETCNAFIMWLTGAAGAGKSAIAQSIAELCDAEGRLLASFFFGRSDPNRNNARSLFATIAYQISLAIPQMRERLAAIVEYDPLIFTRSLSTQFTSLIAKPLRDLFDSGTASDSDVPRLIIIDGLDECLDREVQCRILDVIMNGLRQHHLPLIFLIASRPEHDISTKFNSLEMKMISTRLALDDSYLPDNDIELFLREKFNEIQETHPFKRSIPTSWPTNNVLTSLVRKSSGQFIYASTVIKFVKSSRHQPVNRLEVVLNIRPPSRDLPFAELDALYRHIFSSVEEIDQILHVIGFFILDPSWYPADVVEKYLSLDFEDVQRIFCDLGAVIALEIIGDPEDPSTCMCHIGILHASLSDFLLDQTRSKEFYIDIDLKRTEHLRKSFQLMTYTSFSPSEDNGYMSAMRFVVVNCRESLPTADLGDDILNFPIARIYKEGSGDEKLNLISYFHHVFLPSFFDFLKTSKFDGADQLFAHHLQSFHQVVMHHLQNYYSDMRLTFLVLLIDFTVKRKHADYQSQYFRQELILFDVDSTLRSIDILNLISYSMPYSFHKYFTLLHDFLGDPTLSGECAFDSAKYATAAFVCLAYLCDHVSTPQAISPHHTTGRSENRMKHYNMLAWLAGRRGRWVDPLTHTQQEHGRRRNTPWIWLRRNKMHHTLGKSLGKCSSQDPRMLPLHSEFSNPLDALRLLTTKYSEYFYYTGGLPAKNQSLWSKKYSLALQYLCYFLPRSGRSLELLDFARRHTLASRSQEFPNRSKRARRVIAQYLQRMDAAE